MNRNSIKLHLTVVCSTNFVQMTQCILYVEITNLTQEVVYFWIDYFVYKVLCSTKSTSGKLSQQKSWMVEIWKKNAILNRIEWSLYINFIFLYDRWLSKYYCVVILFFFNLKKQTRCHTFDTLLFLI